ncbi:MAG: hypothetical protein IJC09_01345 [Clostridia bacterium]|nr:hypothetical protein [Clostridia bacterium]
MDIYNYGTMSGEKKRKRKRHIAGIVIILIILMVGIGAVGVLTSNGPEYQMRKSIIEENHALKEENAELTNRIEKLEKELQEKEDYIEALPEPEETETPEEPSTPRD